MINYYEILDVTKTSTTKEIKHKYYRLALQYHPDKNTEKNNSTEKFKLLSEAYTTLSNPKKRFLYDIHLFLHLQPNTIVLSEDDIEIIHKYYLSIIQSSEYKLFMTLYSSLPKIFKKGIYEKFQKNKIISTTLIDISDIKYIDISQLNESYSITLIKKLKDLYELKSHQIMIVNSPIKQFYHIFITESNYHIVIAMSEKINLKIDIVSEKNKYFIIDNSDIYYQNCYNLYQYYFVNDFFLSLPNNQSILYRLSDSVLEGKGFYNPRLKRRGNLYFHHKLELQVNDIEKYKNQIYEIFST